MSSVFIVLPILTLLMFDLGLGLQGKDFLLLLQRPKAVLVGLIGQLVLLPLVAVLLTKLFPLPPIMAVGFVLIACCPGGSSSNVFSMLAKGDVALSVSLTALSSIITLFTLPLIMQAQLDNTILAADESISLPVGKLLVQNFFTMLLPVVAGILTRRYAACIAAKIEKVLSKAAFPCLILLAAVFFIQEFAAIRDNIGRLGMAVLSLLLVCMSMGALLARLFKLRKNEKRSIIIEIGMQNAAQAIALAASPFVFNDSRIAVPAIIYALFMNIVLLSYVGIIKLRKER